MAHKGVVVESLSADRAVRVTLDRPEKRNALSVALRGVLCDVLDGLARDPDVSVVVITGAGESFCAGFDLGEFSRLGEADFAEAFWESSDRWHRRLMTFPIPIIAAINGPALAGGFDLALLCDVRIASEHASVGHTEVRFVAPLVAPLEDIAGAGVARDLCMTGRIVDAAEALRMGIVSSVIPAGDLAEESERWAAQIAAIPRSVLVRTKERAVRLSALEQPFIAADLSDP